jgi:ethanolamine-phosphate cytidylyltransferase
MVGRMLLMTRERDRDDKVDSNEIDSMSQGSSRRSPYTGVSKFSTTNQRIVQFSKGIEPGPNDKIVYIDGVFDLFRM